MSMIQSDLLLGQEGGAGYTISRSLRFNSSDSAYLSRTPASAGNRKTWTWAGWVKRTGLDGTRYLFDDNGVTSTSLFIFSDKIYVQLNGLSGRCVTNAVFRDPSAWFHIVWSVDTTQSTAANRNRLYVNGVEQTFSSSAYPSQNVDTGINAASLHQIGYSFDGYLADVHLIDGQALTPSSFTEVSATTGQLIPKAYTGSFGTNGFWLKFSDNSAATATTLGKDYSGNSNNFTPNNVSVTAGAGNDSLVDTPSSAGTDTGVGGQVTGNYCTWNPLASILTYANLTDGNLQHRASNNGAYYSFATGTLAFDSSSSTGFYFEITQATYGQYSTIGLFDTAYQITSATLGDAIGLATNAALGISYETTGTVYNFGTSITSQPTYTSNGDVIGIAVKDNKVWFSKNNTWISGSPSSGTSPTATLASAKRLTPVITGYNSGVYVLNAGQRPFAYTAPSGFKALCDTNLPAPVVAKPSTAMDVLTWTGNGAASRTISGLGFSPDFVWIKSRSTAGWHALVDQVRGAGKILASNDTASEYNNTGSNNAFQAFTSDGFTIGQQASWVVNDNSVTQAAWCWDAGSSTVTNTQGSITSQVRANASAGFSIVTVGSIPVNDVTIGHGLGVAPQFIFGKNRDDSLNRWMVYHHKLTPDTALFLNLTNGETGDYSYSQGIGAVPTSTTFPIRRNNWGASGGQRLVFYCFAPVAGYSSMSSFVANASSDGPFVFCNFRPRFLLVKNTTRVGPWMMLDTSRDPYNVSVNFLEANDADAEAASQPRIDFLSNGFKVRAGSGYTPNDVSGDVYVFAAFAESPFAYSRAR